MSDKSTVLLAALVGGATGAVIGYFYLTDDGASRRVGLEPRLRELVAEGRRLRATVEDAILAAREGWDVIAGLAARDAAMPTERRSRASETLH